MAALAKPVKTHYSSIIHPDSRRLPDKANACHFKTGGHFLTHLLLTSLFASFIITPLSIALSEREC
jgi:hypothetical protein